MAWCRHAPSHYLSQCWLRSISPYGMTRPQWAEASTKCLAICRLHFQLHFLELKFSHPDTAPSHYLNWCCFIINLTSTNISKQKVSFKKIHFKILSAKCCPFNSGLNILMQLMVCIVWFLYFIHLYCTWASVRVFPKSQITCQLISWCGLYQCFPQIQIEIGSFKGSQNNYILNEVWRGPILPRCFH